MDETITIQVEDDRLLLRLHDNTNNIREGACVLIGETRFTWSGGLSFFIGDVQLLLVLPPLLVVALALTAILLLMVNQNSWRAGP